MLCPLRPAALGAVLALAATMPALAQPRDFADAVVEELNFARTHPAQYARTLRDYRRSFHGGLADEANDGFGVSTFEGPAAVDEAIDFLERQPPREPLTASPILARAAARHAADQGPRGLMGHTGTDGSTLGQRIQRYGIWGGVAAENISYGADDPAAVIRQLIIDDGVRSRSHRADIFSVSLRVVGVGCGPHREYGTMCVLDFAGSIQPLRR
jgi:uncharacterized protein YkwD